MKQLQLKNKIICAITILIIIMGACIAKIKGFNFDIQNQASQIIEINIAKQFELSDIKQITKEVFGNEQTIIQKVEVYEDYVAITAKQITDEQKNNIVTKVNEKYGTELKAEDISTRNIPHVRLRDIVKPYILPLVISTAIILIYIGVRYFKLGIIKSILKTGLVLIVAQLALFGLMAITRIPIGKYTLPLTLFVYVVTLIGITIDFEKQLQEKKMEETEE